jgi:hypothetical protein
LGLGLSFAGGGALLILIGVFWFWRIRRFLKRAVATEGTVLGHEMRASSSSSGGTSTSYHPVVQFVTADGQPVQYTERFGSSPPSHDVGETVPVKYDPSQPDKARIATGFRLWFGPVLVGGMGLVFLVVGVIVVGAS